MRDAGKSGERFVSNTSLRPDLSEDSSTTGSARWAPLMAAASVEGRIRSLTRSNDELKEDKGIRLGIFGAEDSSNA